MTSNLTETDELLKETTRRSIAYLHAVDERSVAPTEDALKNLESLVQDLPVHPTSPSKVLTLLDEYGSPATVASNGRRYFGFVVGGTLPAALAAHWIATSWNQVGAKMVMSPVAIKLEDIAIHWIKDLFGLPNESDGAFVSGATMANFTGLAAARHAVLDRVGWNVERDGLFGAPAITVVVGEEFHSSVGKAITMLGLGRDRVIKVPTDGEGRIRADSLPSVSGPTILCVQAGNVNTGAFDPFPELVKWARKYQAWVHVDGAFGLWATASPRFRHLTTGLTEADSWATDGHKWLNVPYDSGIILVRKPLHMVKAMGNPSAAYLHFDTSSDRFEFTPEQSRRARGVDAWAALLSLGQSGLINLIETCSSNAYRFATLLREGGCMILNDVVLNQVLVSFGEDDLTRAVVKAVQKEGTCWCGETVWKGKVAMRISVSSAKTTQEDVDRSATSILRIFKDLKRSE